MQDLNYSLDFEQCKIQWHVNEFSMKPKADLSEYNHVTYQMYHQAKSTNKLVQYVLQKILDFLS